MVRLQGSSILMPFVGIVSEDGDSIQGWFEGERLRLERMGRDPATESRPEKPSASGPEPAGAKQSAAADPEEVLSRAREKLADTARRLLRYTCLETTERSYYSKPPEKLGSDAMTAAPDESCDGRGFSKDGLGLDEEDRLRLEVAVANGEQIHSWVGASFDSRSVFDLVQQGPRSSGEFGTGLVDVFEKPDRRYTFLGEKSEGSRELLEYGFEVPLKTSHYSVKAAGDWIRTAYHGSFAIDARTGDLTRLTCETAELAPGTQMCRARTTTDYHWQQIGDGQFLIPSQSELDTVSPDATETHSLIVFSACKEYTAESSLEFDTPVTAAALRALPKTPRPFRPACRSLWPW